jgi:hypothetical protein
VSDTPSGRFRARLDAMTPAEQAAALDRLLRFIAPTDEEIAADIEAMTDEEIDAGLRADGIDPQAWADEVRRKIEAGRVVP